MERRHTIQKELVLNAVRDLHNHASAEEVYGYIVKKYPSMGKGTVYRNLNILSDEKEIQKICVPDGADRFDHITDKHHHMRCLKCGNLIDVRMKSFDIEKYLDARRDYLIQDYDIIFKGICSECQNK
ncbi:MAG: transcriptional repressor [Erysipelotrichaceae bacterium]|nr:transcriptional repressor [Erysipelotrichaceae bacterium]